VGEEGGGNPLKRIIQTLEYGDEELQMELSI
jgi:hypothetical protein